MSDYYPEHLPLFDQPRPVPPPVKLPTATPEPERVNLGRPDPSKARNDCQKILNLLRQGVQLMPALEEICCGYRQRISDLRGAGYVIKCRRRTGRLSEYELVEEPK